MADARTVADGNRHLQRLGRIRARTFRGTRRRGPRCARAEGARSAPVRRARSHVARRRSNRRPRSSESAWGPPGDGDDLAGVRDPAAGQTGWGVWPLGAYVVRRGMSDPARALQTLHALTHRLGRLTHRLGRDRDPPSLRPRSRTDAGDLAALEQRRQRTRASWSARASGHACSGACGCARWWTTRHLCRGCCACCRATLAPACGAAWRTT